MKPKTVPDAIEMARWSRWEHLPGLGCLSDAGSQFTSIRDWERLAEIGSVPSIGTVDDSLDNALAETVIGITRLNSSAAANNPDPEKPLKSSN